MKAIPAVTGIPVLHLSSIGNTYRVGAHQLPPTADKSGGNCRNSLVTRLPVTRHHWLIFGTFYQEKVRKKEDVDNQNRYKSFINCATPPGSENPQMTIFY